MPDEHLLSNGDVLFNRTRIVQLSRYVKVVVPRIPDGRSVSFTSSCVCGSECHRAPVSGYLCHVMNSHQGRQHLSVVASRERAATIGISQVISVFQKSAACQTVVLAATLDEQDAYLWLCSTRATRGKMRRRVERKNAAELRRSRHALMSVLLTGELLVGPETGGTT